MKDKRITLLWVVLLFAAAYGLYLVKYEVEDVRQQVVQAERELDERKDALHMLRAEWAYLNRPQRLRKLVDVHLDMMPLRGERVVELAVIPEYPHEETHITPASLEVSQ